MKKLLKALKIIIVILILVFVALVIQTRFFPNNKGIFGIKVYVIVSESMEPQLKIGDIVIVKDTEYSKIKPGDIIAYQGMISDYKDKIITHEVQYTLIEDERYIFYTKGTANNAIDPAVYEKQVYGKVIFKPILISLLSRLIRTIWGFALIVILPLALTFIIEIKEAKRLIKKKE